MTVPEEHYRALDASPSLSLEEIRILYRDLAQVWHPDRFQENPRLREKAEAKLKEINHAYAAIRSGHQSGDGTNPANHPTPEAETAPAPRASSRSEAWPNISEAEADALGWYAKAAAEGHADAQCIIATMYAEGQQVSRDEAKAIAWFKRSAAQGHAAAEYQMGLRYYSGGGVTQSPKQAFFYYQRAALQGHAKAQFSLGIMFTNGAHIAQDNLSALAWFSIAAENGHAEADTLRQSVAATLGADQHLGAEKLAADLRSRIRLVG